jgi:hypothetical protein
LSVRDVEEYGAIAGVAHPPLTSSRACEGVTSSDAPAFKCRRSTPGMKVANFMCQSTRGMVVAWLSIAPRSSDLSSTITHIPGAIR